jgi:hypothetical protein
METVLPGAEGDKTSDMAKPREIFLKIESIEIKETKNED